MARHRITLPLEIQQRIVQICVADTLQWWDVTSTSRALGYATISKAIYHVVVQESYHTIDIGGWSRQSLKLCNTKKLARTFEAKRQLASHVQYLAITLGKEQYSTAWVRVIRKLLDLIEPRVLRFDTNAPIESLLDDVKPGRIRSLFTPYDEDISLENGLKWLKLLSGASPTLEALTVTGCLASTVSQSSYDAVVPLCPNLRDLQASIAIDEVVSMLEEPLNTNLYETLIVKHGKQITTLNLTPFQFTRTKKLSQVAMLPNLKTVQLHFVISQEVGEVNQEHYKTDWLYTAFEYKQIEDLKAFPSVQELSFVGNGLSLQHMNLMRTLTRLLANPRWLPNLAEISLEDFRFGYKGEAEAQLLENAIMSHLKVFEALSFASEARKVELCGGCVYSMSCYYRDD